ncbi:MAG TPA: hypothetical protein VH914_20595 [Acidimicrobiia bacterium]|nr:hypothetical protein [Acidimicrobiia bacterium]
MLAALGIAVVGVVVVVLGVALNDWGIHGLLYRRYRNRSARARGHVEPYPNGHLRPDARRLALERRRARRPLLLVFAVGLVVVGVANEVARANRTTRIRGVGEIVIGVVALFVCLQASAKGPA